MVFFGLAWQGIMFALIPVGVQAVKGGPKIWGGNLQFSEDGFLEANDVSRIHHEIKVIL